MKTTNHAFIAILIIAFGFTIILQLSRSTVIVLSYLTQAVKDMYVQYYDQTQELSFIIQYDDIITEELQMVAVPVVVEQPQNNINYALELVASGMSQRGVARLTGVPQTAISRAINGVKR